MGRGKCALPDVGKLAADPWLGIIRERDLATQHMQDRRLYWIFDVISPFAYLGSLPPDLKAAISKAFLEAPTKAKAAFDKLSDGKDKEFTKVDAKYYEPVVELIKFIDQLRKQKS